MADKPDESTPPPRPGIPKVPKPGMRTVTPSPPVGKPPPPPGAARPPAPRPTAAKPAADEETTDTQAQGTRVVTVASIMATAPTRPTPKPAPEPAVTPPSTGDWSINVDGSLSQVPTEVGLAPEVERKTFDDAASPYTSQLRDVMLEIGFGEPGREWLESARSTLRALVAMAETTLLHDHARTYGEFSRSIDAALAKTSPLADADRSELLRSYQPVVALGPAAPELEAERDRRQRAIVHALLGQIDGVEAPTIDKLHSAGLDRLDLGASTADEVATATGLRRELAVAIVERFATYRRDRRGLLAAGSRAEERKRLEQQVEALRTVHDGFVRVARQWSDEARTQKRALRRQRDVAFHRVRLMLARLGEADLLDRLATQAYADRIATITSFFASHPEI